MPEARICLSCGHANPWDAEVCEVCSAPLERRVEKTVALPEGTVLKNKYAIVRLLGHGGFGLTYLIQDTVLMARRVLKELFPEGSRRDGLRVVLPRDLRGDRFTDLKVGFLKEAQVLARFSHPYIPSVFEYFEDNGTVYYVMEFIEGDPLSKLFQKHSMLNVPKSLRLTLEILDILDMLHENGILHMDIKPDNILMPPKVNHVVLIDFGSAVEIGSGEKPGTVTPGYSPPEQAGVRDDPLGPWSDLYAVGATLYQMLTGQVPPSATDRAMGVELMLPHQLNPRIPEEVSQVVMQFLQMDPQERFQNVVEAREAIEDTGILHDGSSGTPVTPSRRRGSSVLERLRARRARRKEARSQRRSQSQQHRPKENPSRPSTTSPDTLPPPQTPVYQFLNPKRVSRSRVVPVAATMFGQDLFVVWSDQRGSLYNAETLQEERFSHLPHKTLPTSVAFSPKGWFATGETAGVIRVWSTANFQYRLTLKGHTSWITDLRVGLEPSWLVSSDASGTLIVWDIAKKKVSYTGKVGKSWGLLATMISPRILLYADVRGHVVLLDIRRKEKVHEITVKGPFLSAGLHRLSMKLFLGTPKGELVVINLHDLQEEKRWKAHVSAIRAVVTFSDLPLWCSLDDEGTIKIWEEYAERASFQRKAPSPLTAIPVKDIGMLILSTTGEVIQGTIKGPEALFSFGEHPKDV